MIGDLTMKLLCRLLPVVLCGLTAVSCGATDSSTAATTTVPPVKPSAAAVQILANGCSQVEVHGAGLMVAPGKVATVAHVVAGANDIEVRGARGASEATVVYFDPILDVAVLKVDPEIATSIPIGDASPGDQGSVIVYRDDAPIELPAGVQRLVNIRTADIYGEGKHVRPGYELTLDIRAGDSGAVVVIDDEAVALVWATSRQAEARAWAMRTSLIADHLAADTPVDNGECV